jgi:quinol monooxygenase YgiN
MLELIRFNVHVAVKEGRLEDFKTIAREWSAHHLSERPDILSYEWFFKTEDQSRAIVLELYESSAAMLATMGQVAEAEEVEEPDYPYDMIKIDIFGNASDALRERLDAGKSKIDYYNYIDGYTRS